MRIGRYQREKDTNENHAKAVKEFITHYFYKGIWKYMYQLNSNF